MYQRLPQVVQYNKFTIHITQRQSAFITLTCAAAVQYEYQCAIMEYLTEINGGKSTPPVPFSNHNLQQLELCLPRRFDSVVEPQLPQAVSTFWIKQTKCTRIIS